MSEHGKRFRVALSFPGGKRDFVKQVADQLSVKLQRERVFYDAYYEAELARPDLDIYLQNLYHDEADLIVVFLCADYERKEWCGLEWRAVRDLLKQKQTSAIMPMRFDDTHIPGLFSIDGYVSIDERPAEEIANLILQRLTCSTPQPSNDAGLAQRDNSEILALTARLVEALDDYLGDESSDGCSYEAIHPGHPIHEAVVAVQERFFKKMLPDKGPDLWRELIWFSRANDHSPKNHRKIYRAAHKFREWVKRLR